MMMVEKGGGREAEVAIVESSNEDVGDVSEGTARGGFGAIEGGAAEEEEEGKEHASSRGAVADTSPLVVLHIYQHRYR